MARTFIRNNSLGTVSLPVPYNGVLPPSAVAVVSTTVAQTIANFGGVQYILSELSIEVAPDSSALTPHDPSFVDIGSAVVKKVTVTLTQATIAALGAATSGNIPIGAALPANARVVGYDIGEGTFTGIDDATHATWNVSLGGAGAADISANVNCSAGQTGFPKAGTAGALGFLMAPQGGQQLNAHVSSSVNMSTCTAGNVVVNVFYVDVT